VLMLTAGFLLLWLLLLVTVLRFAAGLDLWVVLLVFTVGVDL